MLRQQLPELFELGKNRLFGKSIVPRDPGGHAFPRIWAGQMNVKPRLLGQRQKLVQFRDAVRIQRVRMRIERPVGKEDANAVPVQRRQLREIRGRRRCVKLLPDLWGPARTWPVVAHAERHKWLPLVRFKPGTPCANLNMRQGGGVS